MPEPIEVPSGLKKLGEPNRISVYRNTHGEACFAVLRWDDAVNAADGADADGILGQLDLFAGDYSDGTTDGLDLAVLLAAWGACK
jgi:hypothetical protein